MKTLLLAAIILFSFNSFACRPNIHLIRQNLVMKALTGAYRQEGLLASDLAGVELKDFKMSWEGRDSGTNCPTLYLAKVAANYRITDGVAKYVIDVNSKDEDVVILEIQE